MGREIKCPNCGAQHSLVNPGVTMLICSSCRTVVYWGQDEVLRLGRQSILPESDARLYHLATGSLRGTAFQVVGHLRYEHPRGAWDEWYLQFADGRIGWLSEDERQLTQQDAVAPDPSLPAPDQLRVGMSVVLDGTQFTVREVNTASCVGGDGQLPFTVMPGEQYVYADLAAMDGTRTATLEYDEGQRPTCFVGVALAHDEVRLDDERPPSTKKAHQGEKIKCDNCAAPLDVPGDRVVETRVCEYCGAQLDLSATEQRVLGINPPDFHHGFTLEIGEAGTIEDSRYEVCGRMYYADAEGYATREYLLFNPDCGYLWLAEENGHYVLNHPTEVSPDGDPRFASQKSPVYVGDRVFRVFETGHSHLQYVDGALPWRATVGDHHVFCDLIAPPKMFGIEYGEDEVEFFDGDYWPAAEVWATFGKEGHPPRSVGVHGAQPFRRSIAMLVLMIVGGLVGAGNGWLLLQSTTQEGEQVFSSSLTADQYREEFTTDRFHLPETRVVRLETSAPVNNSWVALGLAFVNDSGEVVGEMEGEVSYYHGVEDGESWTEGGQVSSTYFRAPVPGSYRLIVSGDGGSGETGPARDERIEISLYAGAVLSRYFMAAAIVALLFPVLGIAWQVWFEHRRWSEVTEDDDD